MAPGRLRASARPRARRSKHSRAGAGETGLGVLEDLRQQQVGLAILFGLVQIGPRAEPELRRIFCTAQRFSPGRGAAFEPAGPRQIAEPKCSLGDRLPCFRTLVGVGLDQPSRQLEQDGAGAWCRRRPQVRDPAKQGCLSRRPLGHRCRTGALTEQEPDGQRVLRGGVDRGGIDDTNGLVKSPPARQDLDAHLEQVRRRRCGLRLGGRGQCLFGLFEAFLPAEQIGTQ